MDPRNTLSLAVMLSALYDDMGETFAPDLLFNTDVTTLYLTDDAEPVWVTEDHIKKSKMQRRGVSETKKTSHQDRTISLMTTTSAVGALACVIAVNKDSDVEELIMKLVGDKTIQNTSRIRSLMKKRACGCFSYQERGLQIPRTCARPLKQ
jgi:hypothetical protein